MSKAVIYIPYLVYGHVYLQFCQLYRSLLLDADLAHVSAQGY
jgi:hypothetical protein